MARKLLAILLLVCLGSAVGLWASNRRTAGRIWKLPDGSELSFVRATSGTRHEVVYGTRWRDKVYPLLPANLQSKLRSKLGSKAGASVAVHTTANPDAIVVWFRVKTTAPLFASKSNPAPYCIAVVDGDGIEAGWQTGPNSIYGLPKSGELQAWELSDYPRRSKLLGIRIYAPAPGGVGSRLGEFQIRNRRPNQRPGWVAETLPATRATNELQISLLEFETGLRQGEDVLTGAPGRLMAASKATFQILERGKPTPSWRAAISGISAASGEMRAGIYRSEAANNLITVHFSGLWLEEPAWKLKVKLSRDSQFPPEETWTFRGVPIPPPREITELNARTNLFGEQIEFLGLSAPHARLPPEWVSTQTGVNLHARTPVPLPGMHFTLAEVRDDQGREVVITGTLDEPSTMGRGATMRELNRAYALAVPDGAKTLDITFALSRDYYVEFTAKPVMAKEVGRR